MKCPHCNKEVLISSTQKLVKPEAEKPKPVAKAKAKGKAKA